MSKGSFRVCWRCHYDIIVEDGLETRDVPLFEEVNTYNYVNEFIVAKDILRVRPFNHINDMIAEQIHVNDRFLVENLLVRFYEMSTLFESLGYPIECTCLMKNYAAYEVDDDSIKRIKPPQDPKCVCKMPKTVVPLYVITVKNKTCHPLWNTTESKWFIPPTLDYIVHPDEREHMERFLAGTDDPVYDLVHELQYNPIVGSHLTHAKKDFEQRKRIKLNAD